MRKEEKNETEGDVGREHYAIMHAVVQTRPL